MIDLSKEKAKRILKNDLLITIDTVIHSSKTTYWNPELKTLTNKDIEEVLEELKNSYK